MFLKISAKSQYALILLSFIAKKDNFVSLHEISDKENISYGYMEEISAALKSKNILESKAGRNGGYKLAKDPVNIKISEIIEIFEGETAPVKCFTGHKCSKEKKCKTRKVWEKLKNNVDDTLGKISLRDII
jgi:Rrf2 family protein